MSDTTPPLSVETRQRKLDDLFCDEPFLSPTMKARRLHEKMDERHPASSSARAGEPPGQRSTLSGLVPEAPEDEISVLWNRRVEMEKRKERLPAPSEVEGPAPGRVDLKIVPGVQTGFSIPFGADTASTENTDAQIITLAEAAALLRAEYTPRVMGSHESDRTERMRRFRGDVLLRWLQHVPSRDLASSEEG